MDYAGEYTKYASDRSIVYFKNHKKEQKHRQKTPQKGLSLRIENGSK